MNTDCVLCIGIYAGGEGWTSVHLSPEHAHEAVAVRQRKKLVNWYLLDDGATLTVHAIDNRNVVLGKGTRQNRRRRNQKLGEQSQLILGGGGVL